MKVNEWANFPNFGLSEFNKNGFSDAYMDFDFISELQNARTEISIPFIIHEGFAKNGHSPNSYHYSGQAADLHISGLNVIEMALQMFKHTEFSIGLYPGWNNPGLHVDNRHKQVFWVRIGDKYQYFNKLSGLLAFGEDLWH